MPRRIEPSIRDAILSQFLAGADGRRAFDPNGLLDEFKKALAERALDAEIDHHLGREGGVGKATRAMATRPSPPTAASSSWRCRATGRQALIRN